MSDPFHVRLLATIEELLTGRGISLVIVPSPDTDTVRRLLTGVFGGVLVIGVADDHPVVVALASSGVPVRCTGRPPDGVILPYVDVDNGDGGRQVAEHFIVSGRQRIGVIAGPRAFPAAQDRLAGFRRTFELAGVANMPVARGDFGFASGVHGMRLLLERAPRLDAVFAAADAMAAGALRTLHLAGRRVPDDIAIVGFDDAPFASRTRPPLTTVRQPVEELAIRATSLLLQDMGGDTKPAGNHTLPTELVVRASAP
jgi:DNA-binding LacI/PurR family transcriptional regulator